MSESRQRRVGEPLLLAPTFDEKAWGGRRLADWGKRLPDGPIGESLESGSNARVVGGTFDGVELGELARLHPSALLGARGIAAAGTLADFPLLVKLIDANADLSIQVHPDDRQAPAGRRGKTEAWYILDAQPGARIIAGVEGPIYIDWIADQLIEVPVRSGDVFLVPAGTVHAIGAGVLLYEIQQASDVTWRLYDWGRPREIHVEQALAVARVEQRVRSVSPLRLDDWREALVACRYFALERWTVSGTVAVPENAESFRVLTVLDGTLELETRSLARGSTVVLPADLPEPRLCGNGELLVGFIPNLERDFVAPLRRAGHSAERVRQLGIDTP